MKSFCTKFMANTVILNTGQPEIFRKNKYRNPHPHFVCSDDLTTFDTISK